jgi:hypothetical protein
LGQTQQREPVTSRYKALYEEIERLFEQLLADPALGLSPAELSEVRHFIDVGEYGIALETAIGILEDDTKSVAVETMAKLRRLAEAMSLDADALLDQLAKAG